MKNPRFYSIVFLSIFILIFVSCINTRENKKAGSLTHRTLTIGASEKLVTSFPAESAKIKWTSNEPDIAEVDQEGVVTALGFSDLSAGTGSAIITAAAQNGKKVTFNVKTTMEGQVDMMLLPPMKDQFSSYFMIGNIFNPGDVSGQKVSNNRLLHHYNVLTAENDMKPDKISPSRGSYNFTIADRMVDSALGSGMRVVGHTLLWHSQIPEWQASLRTNNTSKEDALQYMKEYITRVVSHFKGRIYSWDVINEAFPDGGYNSGSDWKQIIRNDGNGNPWFMKIGSDFVYEGFLATRKADPDAILYYNDYNLDQNSKATMVRNMVRDVNERYKQAFPNEKRLLIEGIGMQSHHNTGISAASIKNSLNLFRPLGVKISISELDVLSQGWGDFSSRTPLTTGGRLMAASLYGNFFKVFLENADIIERVTFWGVYDEQSWRRTAQPLLFEGSFTSNAKPAYYHVIKALNETVKQ